MPKTAEVPPPILERAVGLATADIDAAGHTGVVVTYGRSGEADDAWSVLVMYANEGTGFIARVNQPWPTLLAWVADQVKEAYIDSAWQARPRCPFHEHPLVPTDAGNHANWECPAGSGWERPIGSRGGDAEYLAAIARADA